MPEQFLPIGVQNFEKMRTNNFVYVDHLGKGGQALEIAKTNRDILKYFFGVIKGGDVSNVLRSVFTTGVTIFSELNNLKDITMNRHYAEILGYSQKELEEYFGGYIRGF